jgi:urea transport system ATP-binding protein
MTRTETLLQLDAVSVSFDGFRAINALSFVIGNRELRAVIGPNGAGKTTMMDIITGKTRPDEGMVRFGARGIDLTKLSEDVIARSGIGRKFQRPTVFEQQSVFENLLLAFKNNRSGFAVLFSQQKSKDTKKIHDLAEQVGLEQHLHRIAGELSHGQKQWLEIGMLLAQDPELLLVDEPAAGMTTEERERTTDILKHAAKSRSIVVVEHDMEFVRRLNCRVTVLHEGSVLSEGSIDHVIHDEKVIEVYLGR